MTSGKDLRAGGASVEISADLKKLDANLKRAEVTMAEWANRSAARVQNAFNFKNVGASLAGVGAGLSALSAAMAAPFAAAIADLTVYAGLIQDNADRRGFVVEQFQEMAYAAKITGVPIKDVGNAWQKMQKQISDASSGSKPAIAALAKLGLTAADLKGKGTDEQFAIIADRLNGITDAADKTAATMGVFGRSGLTLLPLFKEGSQGLSALGKEARRLGVVLSQEAIVAADEFMDAWVRLKETLLGVSRSIASAFIPILRPIVDWTREAAGAVSRWAKENGDLFRSIGAGIAVVGAVGAALLATGTAMVAFSFATVAVKTALSLFVGAAVNVASVVYAWTNPFTIALAAFTALTAYVLYATGAGSAAIETLTRTFNDLSATATNAFQGITNAFKAGDFGLAVEILVASFNLGWAQLKAGAAEAWNDVVQPFINGAADIVGAFDLVGKEIYNELTRAFETAFDFAYRLGVNVSASIAKAMVEATRSAALTMLSVYYTAQDVIGAKTTEQAAKEGSEQAAGVKGFADKANSLIDSTASNLKGDDPNDSPEVADRKAREAIDKKYDDLGRKGFEEAVKGKDEFRKGLESIFQFKPDLKAIDDLKEKIDKLTGDAKDKADKAVADGVGKGLPGVGARVAEDAAMLKDSSASRGTFNPFAVSALGGVYSVQERTAKASERTAKATEEIADAAEEGLAFQ